jgi:hypothetical protein
MGDDARLKFMHAQFAIVKLEAQSSKTGSPTDKCYSVLRIAFFSAPMTIRASR